MKDNAGFNAGRSVVTTTARAPKSILPKIFRISLSIVLCAMPGCSACHLTPRQGGFVNSAKQESGMKINGVIGSVMVALPEDDEDDEWSEMLSWSTFGVWTTSSRHHGFAFMILLAGYYPRQLQPWGQLVLAEPVTLPSGRILIQDVLPRIQASLTREQLFVILDSGIPAHVEDAMIEALDYYRNIEHELPPDQRIHEVDINRDP